MSFQDDLRVTARSDYRPIAACQVVSIFTRLEVMLWRVNGVNSKQRNDRDVLRRLEAIRRGAAMISGGDDAAIGKDHESQWVEYLEASRRNVNQAVPGFVHAIDALQPSPSVMRSFLEHNSLQAACENGLFMNLVS